MLITPATASLAINGRSAIFQDVDVINHGEMEEVDVHPLSPLLKNTASAHYPARFPSSEPEFPGQQSTQIGMTLPSNRDRTFLVDGGADLLWQVDEQIGGVVDT